MIAVIADDFTGAAEIGGVGLRYGLNVIIETEAIRHSNADLLVIATDTRSLTSKEAANIIKKITQQLLNLKPEFIFKKVDSVLRGNVADELLAQMSVSGKSRSIVIAANPELKRVIRDGIYYIDDIPLNLTSFANDPEYPVRSSLVREIIGYEPIYTNVLPNNEVPKDGLIFGDANDIKDLEKWAIEIDDLTLPAGASGFFDILIRNRISKRNMNGNKTGAFGEKSLYVLGSTFPKDNEMLMKMEANGYYLSNMPSEIYTNKNFEPKYLEQWANEIVHAINTNKKVIASIFHTPGNEPDIANRIRENIGALIKKVLEKTWINELIIEGGSTTYSVLKHLNIKKLHPIKEIDTGVIRMEMEGLPGLYLTTKPGSYIWPDDFWFFQNLQTSKTIY
jgi:uncharacterized protein YgbK (DUF1537 family)